MSGQIIPKENDLKVISKIVEYLVEERDVGTSRTFLEIKDASGRAFCYVSVKDRAHENSGDAEQSSTMDSVFRRMVERSPSYSGISGTVNKYIEDDEDSQDEPSSVREASASDME